jgi:hypothetical protein
LRNSIGAEIYNIFDNRNSIGQYLGTWYQTNRQIAIPNFLTPRVLNFEWWQNSRVYLDILKYRTT